jgi:hypothetical protein
MLARPPVTRGTGATAPPVLRDVETSPRQSRVDAGDAIGVPGTTDGSESNVTV